MLLRSQRKLVAFQSSLLGSVSDNGSGGYYAYRLAKGALNMIAKNVANDLRSRGVIAVALHPGWVQTRIGGKRAPVTLEKSVAGQERSFAIELQSQTQVPGLCRSMNVETGDPLTYVNARYGIRKREFNFCGAQLVKGYYVKPSIFGRVDPDSSIAQEEIFGPVLSIITYKDEDDAVRIANNTLYGLAGAVWSGSEARAMKAARRIRTGQIDINGGPFNLLAPFGGWKQSGKGRELGRYGIEEFLGYKSLQYVPVK